MADHSFPNILVHAIFSTKQRRNLVPDELQPRLWGYLLGIGKNHNLPVLAAGGIANHAHLLFVLPATVTLSKAIQTFKANSSRWIGEHGITFAWQEGYAAVSVSASNADAVREYVLHQSEHHQKHSFEAEYRTLLDKSGVKYDPELIFG